MKFIKMRLAVFLSVIMVLPSIVAILPMASIEVSAASAYVYASWLGGSFTQVEQGQKFYIGDYVSIQTFGKKSWSGTASMASASYSSDNTSVASVNSNGYFTAKAPGKTKITIKYQGKEIAQDIEVVAAGTFTETAEISKLRELVKKLPKKIPSKITVKNGFSLYKCVADLKAYADKNPNKVSADGYKMQKFSEGFFKSSELAVPQAGRYHTFMAMLQNNFGTKNNPTSTRSAKVMQISSASAKPSAITVKLKSKIDTTQILAARICNEDVKNEQIKGKTKAYIRLSVVDIKSNVMYKAVAEIKKGSTAVKVKSFEKYDTQTRKYVKSKLKKGRTYRIGYGYNTWSKGKTVTVR